MKTDVSTPLEIFNLPQRLQIPLFQRPYVWSEDDQWAPLWKDIQRLADLRLSGNHVDASHFLGAVVVQAQDQKLGSLVLYNIIDGQQRLTTLQLFADAASALLEEAGIDSLAAQLESLTHNNENFVPPGESSLKLRHTNRDRAAFDEVMTADAPVDHEALDHSGSRLVLAHRFFTAAINEWLQAGGDNAVEQRAEALVSVLTSGIQIVAINLSESENSQEIFETLNARGTPLTAADLIKNLVFQRLEAEGADIRRAHTYDWPFESEFWTTAVSVGRHRISRSSLFFNQWLGARVGEEVSPLSTFNRFKYFVEHENERSIGELLPEIKEEADRYQGWIEAAADKHRPLSVVEMNVYRMNASSTALLMPLLIWLHAPGRDLDPAAIDEIVEAAESWVVRRQLLRLPSSDLGRIVAELINENRDAPSDEVAARVRGQLSRLNVASTYWPGDAEVREALSKEAAYRRFKVSRVRMLLEAVEDERRAETKQPQVARDMWPVEHILPQSWQKTWPVEGEEAIEERSAHVHRLGNLTLVTTNLNSSVSNKPWASKRQELKNHDTLLLNSRILSDTESSAWDEVQIDNRTADLIDALFRIWPVPEGHAGQIVDPLNRTNGWVSLKMLVDAGILATGTVLKGRSVEQGAVEASVTDDGELVVAGQKFDTPSGAAKFAKKVKSSNGWTFWRLPDGRRLVEARSEFKGEKPSKSADSKFDWSTLHEILEAMPAGNWTTYSELADAVGTAAQPLGQHVAKCPHCANAYRILKDDGTVSSGFAWDDPADDRDPIEVLLAEGVVFTDGVAGLESRLSSDELAAAIAS